VTVFVLPPSVVVVALASALATTTDDDDDDDVEFLFGYLRSAFFGPPFRRVAFVSLKALPLLDSSVVGAFVDVATNATLVAVVALLASATLATQVGQCTKASYIYCCETPPICDCSKGSTAPGQCSSASYLYCCNFAGEVGEPCDCSKPPGNANATGLLV